MLTDVSANENSPWRCPDNLDSVIIQATETRHIKDINKMYFDIKIWVFQINKYNSKHCLVVSCQSIYALPFSCCQSPVPLVN